MTTDKGIEWMTMDPEGNIDLVAESKAMNALLREDAKTDRTVRKIVKGMEQEAIDGLPDASLTGREFVIGMLDRITGKDRETQGEQSLQLMIWLELLDRDDAAVPWIKEYARYLDGRIGSGKITNKEYAHYNKIGLIDNSGPGEAE